MSFLYGELGFAAATSTEAAFEPMASEALGAVGGLELGLGGGGGSRDLLLKRCELGLQAALRRCSCFLRRCECRLLLLELRC